MRSGLFLEKESIFLIVARDNTLVGNVLGHLRVRICL